MLERISKPQKERERNKKKKGVKVHSSIQKKKKKTTIKKIREGLVCKRMFDG